MFRLPISNREFSLKLKIVKRGDVYDVSRIELFLEILKLEKYPEHEASKIIKDFSSVDFGFDDIYKLKLATCDLLLNIDQKSDRLVRFLDWQTREMSKLKNIEGVDFSGDFYSEGYVNSRRVELRKYGERLLINTKKEITERLALLEVFARLLPNDLIPRLIEVCPKYLGCPFVQKWIMTNQYLSICGNKEQRTISTELIKRLSKAMLPDKRKIKKQVIHYWELDQYYHKLTGYVKGHRLAKKENRLDVQYMNIFFDVWKIPDEYKGHFVSEEVGAKELVLSIMISKGMIASESSFREFQSKINKLKQKHFGVEFMLVLENILDLPIHAPQIIENPRLWDLLEEN